MAGRCREGDYFGRAVNLAARLLSRAQDDELLATADVARATPERPWRDLGEHRLFGFDQAFAAFSLELGGEGASPATSS